MTPMPIRRLRDVLTTGAFLAALMGPSTILSVGLAAALPGGVAAHGPPALQATDLPSISEKTEGMKSVDGFLPLYWDEDQGRLWMEIPRLDQRRQNRSTISRYFPFLSSKSDDPYQEKGYPCEFLQ